MRVLWLGLILLLGLKSAISAAESSANRGRIMWSAFQCSTYAEMAGDQKEQERLFTLGHNVGKAFLSDIQNGTISDDEIKQMPIGVRLLLEGPSMEFIAGRIFESAMRDAYDSIVKEDSIGALLDPSQWVHDDELKTSKAKTAYLEASCEIVE